MYIYSFSERSPWMEWNFRETNVNIYYTLSCLYMLVICRVNYFNRLSKQVDASALMLANAPSSYSYCAIECKSFQPPGQYWHRHTNVKLGKPRPPPHHPVGNITGNSHKQHTQRLLWLLSFMVTFVDSSNCILRRIGWSCRSELKCEVLVQCCLTNHKGKLTYDWVAPPLIRTCALCVAFSAYFSLISEALDVMPPIATQVTAD